MDRRFKVYCSSNQESNKDETSRFEIKDESENLAYTVDFSKGRAAFKQVDRIEALISIDLSLQKYDIQQVYRLKFNEKSEGGHYIFINIDRNTLKVQNLNYANEAIYYCKSDKGKWYLTLEDENVKVGKFTKSKVQSEFGTLQLASKLDPIKCTVILFAFAFQTYFNNFTKSDTRPITEKKPKETSSSSKRSMLKDSVGSLIGGLNLAFSNRMPQSNGLSFNGLN